MSKYAFCSDLLSIFCDKICFSVYAFPALHQHNDSPLEVLKIEVYFTIFITGREIPVIHILALC